MCRGKPHSPEVKAAVMAALLAGQMPSDIAAKYKLPEQTVCTWKKQVRGASLLKKADLSELVESTLRAFLETIRIQAETARDVDWIKKQSASDLGVFLGILSDKAFRILEAANGSDDSEPTESP